MGGLSTTREAGRSWNWNSPAPQGNTIDALSFPAADTGWAVGRSGTVLRTGDAGATWTSLDAGSSTDWHSASFVSTSTGWIAGAGGTVRKTADAGATWTTQTVGATTALRGISFANPTAGIAVGDAGNTVATIRYTTDGGASWSSGATTSTADIYSVSMPSPVLAWAVGASGTMLKSTDGGNSWTSYPQMTGASLNAVSFAKGTAIGYAVGNASGTQWNVFKTTNGTDWARLTLPGTGQSLLGVSCSADGTRVTVVGRGGAIYRSDNGGASWSQQNPQRLGTVDFRAAAVLGNSSAVAAGDRGTIVFTRDGGATWLSDGQRSAYNLNDLSFASQSTGWAVGSGGIVMYTADAGNRWSGKKIASATLRGVSFSDLNNGTAVGDGGVIRRTNNGGATWATQSAGTSSQLNDVWFSNANIGWIVGNGGVIFKTTNGGGSWNAQNSGVSVHLNAVTFSDNQRGWAVGDGGVVIATTNGGSTWVRQTSGTTVRLNRVHANDNSNAMAVGDAGTAIRTTNAGASWTSMTAALGNPTQNLNAVHMATNNIAWVGGSSGFLRSTTNGGASFSAQNPRLPSLSADGAVSINGIWVRENGRGFLVGDSGEVRSTLNSGGVWTPFYYGTPSNLHGVAATSKTDVWAAGDAGAIINSFDGGRTWFQQDPAGTAAVRDIWMDSAGRGWVVGAAGTIRRTATFGWGAWTAQISGTTQQLNGIDSANGTNAVAVGDGVVAWTNNSGTTWNLVTALPTTQPLNGVSMIDAGTGFAVASAGGPAIIKTTNGGATWSSALATSTVTLNGIHFVDANNGWAVGNDGKVLRTSNGGADWVTQTSGTTSDLHEVHFANANVGWASGARGTVIRTGDGGITWRTEDTGTKSVDLRGVVSADAEVGWAVGESGSVLQGFHVVLPISALSVTPPYADGLNDWYVSNPTAVLSMNEPGTIRYSFAGPTGPWVDYTQPFLVPQGTSTLYYYSTDLDSNVEPVQSQAFKVDISAPSQPGALVSSAVSTSSVTLSWSPSADLVSGLSAYRVEVNGAVAQSTGSTSTVLTGLQPNTYYTVTVRAVDNAGLVSESSNSTSFTTQDYVGAALGTQYSANPAAADGLSGWYVNKPLVTLTAVPGPETVPSATYYAYGTAETTPSVWTTYTAPFEAAAGSYTLWYFSDPTGPPARPRQYMTQSLQVDPYPVSAPATVTAAATGPYSISVSFEPTSALPVSGVDRYEVFVAHEATPSAYQLAAVAPAGSTDVAVLGLEPGTGYYVRVRAVSVAGVNGAFTSTDPLVVTELEPTPEPPHVVYARATDGETVYLNWEPSPDFIGTPSYRIWRSTDGVDYSPIAEVTAPYKYSYVDTGLTSSTKYWYGVSTIDFRGESARGSSPSSASSTTIGPPSRPTGLAAMESSGSVLLTWSTSPNPGTSSYLLFRSESSLSQGTTLATVPAATTAYVDTSLLNEKPYYYSVSAVDASGSISPRSQELLVVSRDPEGENTPHGTEENRSDDCSACHRSHTGASPELVFPVGLEVSSENTQAVRGSETGQRLCLGCHQFAASDVKSGLESSVTVSRHSIISSQTIDGTIRCGDCHDSHRSNETTVADPSLLDRDGVRTGDDVCYSCHGESSTLPSGDLRVYRESVHYDAGTPSRAGITCSRCHFSHTSPNEQLLRYSNYMLCVQCHSGEANPFSPDVLSLLTADVTNSGTRHDMTMADQQANGSRITCQNCHNSKTVTSSSKLVDPENPGVTGAWGGSTTNFCFRCHDGSLPTSAQTGDWVEAPLAAGGATQTLDILSAYQTNAHGLGDSVGNPDLNPDMGYSAGSVLSCTTCHDGHGTVNSFALKQNIASADGSVVKQGLLVAPVPGGGYDFRFLCNSCHNLESTAHTAADISDATFPTNCMGSGCHQHTMRPAGSQTTTETSTRF